MMKATEQDILIRKCHGIMTTGLIPICDMYIPTGNCTCCTFNQGNWIGLVPGEMDVLSDGDTTQWDSIHTGIVCSRDPSKCTNKPLDCKLYPFFPYLVIEREHDYMVHLAAGDAKCAAKSILTSALKGELIRKDSTLPFGEHLYRAGLCGVVLHNGGMSEWMRDTLGGYAGYATGYYVSVNKSEEGLC